MLPKRSRKNKVVLVGSFRNYWKYLKARLKREKNELVSATTQLKLIAADGKKYNTDMLDSDGVTALAKNFPNNRSMKFLDWFLYSDTSIDGQSKKKARAGRENLHSHSRKLKLAVACED